MVREWRRRGLFDTSREFPLVEKYSNPAPLIARNAGTCSDPEPKRGPPRPTPTPKRPRELPNQLRGTARTLLKENSQVRTRYNHPPQVLLCNSHKTIRCQWTRHYINRRHPRSQITCRPSNTDREIKISTANYYDGHLIYLFNRWAV